MPERRIVKKLEALAICVTMLLCVLALSPTSATSSQDELSLVLLPDTVDFSMLSSDNLNPLSVPYLIATNAVKVKVTASCKYDLTVKALRDLTATNAQGQVVSTIPIGNLYWQLNGQPGWHPFALSSATVVSSANNGEGEYIFDYRIFSETNALGWEVKPGNYETTLTYSVFPSP